MSAEILREAAAEIRDEWSENRQMGQDRTEWRTWRAVADLLDDHAETAEMFAAKEIPASAWSMNWQTSHNHANAIARAYLGGDA